MNLLKNLFYLILLNIVALNSVSETIGSRNDGFWAGDWSGSSAISLAGPQKASSCVNPFEFGAVKFEKSSILGSGLIDIESGSVEGRLDEEVRLTRGVQIRKGERVIKAPSVRLKTQTRLAAFDDGFDLQDPSFLLKGRSASLDLNVNLLQVNQAEFVFPENSVRVSARTVSQDTNGNFVLSDARLSSCLPSNESWVMTASRIGVSEDASKVFARNLVLRLKGIPIFYTPYSPVPIAGGKGGGVGFPSIGYSSEDGLDIAFPYEMQKSDKYKFSLAPKLITRRGVGFESEFDMRGARQATSVSAGFLLQDRLFNGVVSRDEFDSKSGVEGGGIFKKADRWSGSVNHRGRFGFLETRIDHNFISDQDYFRDVGSDYSAIDREALPQYAGVGFRYGGLSVDLFAEDLEIIDPISKPSYRVAPEVAVKYKADLVGLIRMGVSYRVTKLASDLDWSDGLGLVASRREHFEPTFSLPFYGSHGFAKLEAGYRYSRYKLRYDSSQTESRDNERQTRGVGYVSGDIGTHFSKELDFLGMKLRHNIEPRLYYLHQNNEDQSKIPLFDTSEMLQGYSQLFRKDRFSGIDRIAGANQLSVGFRSSMTNVSNGEEIALFRMGKIFHFEDRQVFLPGMDFGSRGEVIASDFSFSLTKSTRAVGGLVWDKDLNESTQASFHIQHLGGRGQIVNVGLRRLLQRDGQAGGKIEQTDFSLVLPLGERASVFGRWHYDWKQKRTVDGFLGVQYDDCCLRARLGFRKSLDIRASKYYFLPEPDESILLQFDFKGFVDFGSRLDSILKRGIVGYSN